MVVVVVVDGSIVEVEVGMLHACAVVVVVVVVVFGRFCCCCRCWCANAARDAVAPLHPFEKPFLYRWYCVVVRLCHMKCTRCVYIHTCLPACLPACWQHTYTHSRCLCVEINNAEPLNQRVVFPSLQSTRILSFIRSSIFSSLVLFDKSCFVRNEILRYAIRQSTFKWLNSEIHSRVRVYIPIWEKKEKNRCDKCF